MMYPYMTLNDDTEITHSEMKQDGRVKVYIEKRIFENIKKNKIQTLIGETSNQNTSFYMPRTQREREREREREKVS